MKIHYVRWLLPTCLLLIGVTWVGCTPVPWRPTLPSGKTWSYESLHGRGGEGGGGTQRPTYAQLFASEGYVGPRRGEAAGRFWKRINLGSTQLNVRLTNDGEAVRPGVQGPVVASDVAVPFDEEPTDHAKGSQ